jgi:hypothetical protein
MGFNILKNLKTYSKFLAQYYPQSEILRIGLDRLYYHENSKGRVITNTELLGLLAYNRAYFAKDSKNYKAAYDFILLAQQFNSDSRSNVNFEIGLYYAWGSRLFNKKDFVEAFAVFADGYFRYPDNEDFLKNTFASFYRSLENLWRIKNWSETERLIEEMLYLEVFQEKDNRNIKSILTKWLQYFHQKTDKKSYQRVEKIRTKFNI